MVNSTCPNCLFAAFSENINVRKGEGMSRMFVQYKCGNCGCTFEDVMVFEETIIMKEGELPRLNLKEVEMKFGKETAVTYREAIADFVCFLSPQKSAQEILNEGEITDAMKMLAAWTGNNNKEMAKAFIRQLYQDFYA